MSKLPFGILPSAGKIGTWPNLSGNPGWANNTRSVILSPQRFALLKRTAARLGRLQKLVGYANFSLLSFDDAIKYARNYSRVGKFKPDELDFLEELFFGDVTRFGFYGDKVTEKISARVHRREIIKVPATGQYLFKGTPLKTYKNIRQDVGESLILTSGVRNVVKQMRLFLAKAVETSGNLSLASRSLAPPGHSYHGSGDFDVGKKGFGKQNFTNRFARTEEFKRLNDLGYVVIRYPHNNPFGVRFEPWHIKVV